MLENFSFRTIVEYLPLFGEGLVTTVWLSAISFLGALLVGILLCALNLQRPRFARLPAKAYIDVVRATPLLAQKDYAGAMRVLASLRAPVDAFFLAVMVNDADNAIRMNRLSLLARLRAQLQRIANFDALQG